LSPSTLTGLLNNMERAGLIRRSRDLHDGRALRISLTPLGKSLRPRATQLMERIEATLEGGMSTQEIRTLKLLLRKVIANIRQSS
jgi:DNA-binding MarR family transcriptional regulator